MHWGLLCCPQSFLSIYASSLCTTTNTHVFSLCLQSVFASLPCFSTYGNKVLGDLFRGLTLWLSIVISVQRHSVHDLCLWSVCDNLQIHVQSALKTNNDKPHFSFLMWPPLQWHSNLLLLYHAAAKVLTKLCAESNHRLYDSFVIYVH